MEKTSQTAPQGTRSFDLKKSFKLSVRPLLTTCSKEDFSRAFPTFTDAEQERLLWLFIEVLTSLHENIEDQFESICAETQVETTIDTIEQLVDEQSLDPLFSVKTNVGAVVQSVSVAKKKEIQYLTEMLEKAKKQNYLMNARIEILKKEKRDLPVAGDAGEKLRAEILNYEDGKDTGLRDP